MSSDSDEDFVPLSEFRVIEVGQGRKGEVLYTVRKSDSERAPLYSWRATRWKVAESSRGNMKQLRREIKYFKLIASPSVVVPNRVHFHASTSTFYTITDHIPHPSLSQLHQKCKDEGRVFRENFLWNILRQLAALCDDLQSMKSEHWSMYFDSSRIYVDSEAQVIIEPLVPDKMSADNNDHSLICKIGSALLEICTPLEEEAVESTEYLSELKKTIRLMQCDFTNSKCTKTCNIVLFHPTVLSHIDKSKEIFVQSVDRQASVPSNDSAFESDESIKNINIDDSKTALSPSLVALDLKIPGYVPRKLPDRATKWLSHLDVSKEPREVSEDALNRVWLQRLETLQKREKRVELKEKEMAKKELFDEIRSKISYDEKKDPVSTKSSSPTGITLKTVMTNKNIMQDLSNSCFESKSIISPLVDHREHDKRVQKYYPKRNRKKRININYEDLDSSLSADPGDSSIILTSSKLTASKVPRPSSMCNIGRKKVHFNSKNNPFAEYDSVSSTVFTFFDIDNDNSYEIPIKSSKPKDESIVDKIAKFSYFDLETMTNKKRELMENAKKKYCNTPPLQKENVDLKIFDEFDIKPVIKRKNRKEKYFSPGLDSQANVYKSTSEISSILNYPTSKKAKGRMSIPFLAGGIKQSTPKEVPLNLENRRITRSQISIDSKKNEQLENKSKKKSTFKNQDDKENCQTPGKFKRDGKRRSILGFKTPFKFGF